jgi:N-acetylneuraminate synthase/N,N'-diacetyllegionaminate synthase
MTPKPFRIADREIGGGAPCFVIAEAGVNHNGSLAMALQLVDAAARAGADAVKFQTFKAEQVISRAAPKAEYQVLPELQLATVPDRKPVLNQR